MDHELLSLDDLYRRAYRRQLLLDKSNKIPEIPESLKNDQIRLLDEAKKQIAERLQNLHKEMKDERDHLDSEGDL